MTDTNTAAPATAPAAPSPEAPALPAIATDAVTVIKPSERVALPSPPGAGFHREACFDDGHVWTGFVSTDPGSASPWHHHGEHTTYALLLQGECVVEFGSERLHLRADGSMAVLPPGLVHREINTGATKNQFFIMRVGHGPAVFPAEAPPRAS